MRTLRPEAFEAIAHNLKQAPGQQARVDQTTGGVYCLERNLECVPFTVAGYTFLLEFQVPYFSTQVQLYNSILFKTKSGGYFVPKLQFRYLDIGCLTEDYMVSDLCKMPAAELTKHQAVLAGAIRNALIVYYRSYPGVNQYFYMYDASTKDLLHKVCTDIPPAVLEKYAFENYADLAEPHGGFSLTSKSL